MPSVTVVGYLSVPAENGSSGESALFNANKYLLEHKHIRTLVSFEEMLMEVTMAGRPRAHYLHMEWTAPALVHMKVLGLFCTHT